MHLSSTALYYKDGKYFRITIHEFEAKYKNPKFGDYIRRDNLFYILKSGEIVRAVAVLGKGNRYGFKVLIKKPVGNTNPTLDRGEAESITHTVNKNIICTLDEFTINFNDRRIVLYIDTSQNDMEGYVICNGRMYRYDICLHLLATDPEEYYDIFQGEVYIEVVHSAPVPDHKAINFAGEHRSLFQVILSHDFLVKDGEEHNHKVIERIKSLYSKGITGRMMEFWWEDFSPRWKISSNKHQYLRRETNRFYTLVQYGNRYRINYTNKYGETDQIIKYQGEFLNSERMAKTAAEAEYYENHIKKKNKLMPPRWRHFLIYT